jgi:anaerobic ribonucleoside-triphosphate reductase activating protein
MQVNKILSGVRVLGPGSRMVIWFQGCGKRCPGCIAPEMQSYSGGFSIDSESLRELIRRQQHIDGVTLSGGEPFDQSGQELADLVECCDEATGDVLLYTGYSMEQLKNRTSPDILGRILRAVSALVTDPYVEALDDGCSGLMGSKNQQIWIMKNKEKYMQVLRENRTQQIFADEQGIFVAGIPGNEFRQLLKQKGEHGNGSTKVDA